jgi:hypothetical protein
MTLRLNGWPAGKTHLVTQLLPLDRSCARSITRTTSHRNTSTQLWTGTFGQCWILPTLNDADMVKLVVTGSTISPPLQISLLMRQPHPLFICTATIPTVSTFTATANTADTSTTTPTMSEQMDDPPPVDHAQDQPPAEPPPPCSSTNAPPGLIISLLFTPNNIMSPILMPENPYNDVHLSCLQVDFNNAPDHPSTIGDGIPIIGHPQVFGLRKDSKSFVRI